MKLMSYWLDTAPRFSGARTEPPNGEIDVAVVGAGFTGLSAALALAKKGASVAVFEAGLVGNAASGRNGGMCNNGFAQDYHALSTTLGTDRANMLYRAFDAGRGQGRVADCSEEGIDCDFKRVGKLKLAAKPAALRQARAVAGAAGAARSIPDTHMVTRADVARPKSGRTAITAAWSLRRAPACMWASSARGSRRPQRPRRADLRERARDGPRPLAGRARGADAHAAACAPPGAARHRNFGGGPARLVPPAHRSGGRVHHRHRAAAAVDLLDRS